MGAAIGVGVVLAFLYALACCAQWKLSTGLAELTETERAAVLASLDDPDGWFHIDHATPDEIRSDDA